VALECIVYVSSWEEPHGTLSLQIWPESGGAPVCVSVRWGSVFICLEFGAQGFVFSWFGFFMA